MAPPDTAAQRSTVTYQELADIESEFDDFNVELLLHQATRERALYERRAGLVRRIAGFWPLVFEQAPPEIDQCVQPADAALLLSALEDIEVTRFEVAGSEKEESDKKGDPRSVAIRFTFAPNDVFEDRVLEKRFWYRQAPAKATASKNASGESWSGLVSEPVPIRWKKGKDLTGGLLDLAVKVWQASAAGAGGDSSTEHKAALEAELSKTAVGGISFFAWFGYVGRRISAEESQATIAQAREQRAARAARRAEKGDEVDEEEEDNEDDEAEEEDGEYEYEIFPDGDTVALTLAEDLWPNAVKYFRQAQEQETLSDADFESGMEDDDEDEEEEENGEDDVPPAKKQRT